MDIEIEEIKKTIDEYGSTCLELLLSGKDMSYCIVNSLRHVTINQIPIYAFHHDKINIFKNTSVYDNSYMKGRLNQLPINNIKHKIKFLSQEYYKNVNYADPNIVKHPDDTYEIEYYIKAKNNGKEKLQYVSTNDIRITINNELVDNSKVYSTEYPILIIKLRPGEEFECSMKAVLGIGELHSIFNAATTYYEEITETKYNLMIKSYGQLSEYELLILGCEIIIEKYNNIKENIKNNEYKYIITEENSIMLEILNEDHTCGGPLNHVLQDMDEVIFSGVTRPDFLQKCVLIKFKVDKKFKLFDILNKAIDTCINLFTNIKNNLSNLQLGNKTDKTNKSKVNKVNKISKAK